MLIIMRDVSVDTATKCATIQWPQQYLYRRTVYYYNGYSCIISRTSASSISCSSYVCSTVIRMGIFLTSPRKFDIQLKQYHIRRYYF